MASQTNHTVERKTRMILPAEKYIELTVDLAEDILHSTYLDRVFKEGKNDTLQYTEEAQGRFEEHLDMVCGKLNAHGIYKEGEV
jgi:hypothetical protein